MANPRAYPVYRETEAYKDEVYREAVERITQKITKVEFSAYKVADNVVYEQPPKPATSLDPWSDPLLAAPTEELNQSYKDEEDPLRVDNIFKSSYNAALQELIKKRLNVNAKIVSAETQIEYQPIPPYSDDTSPIGSPKFNNQPVIKLKVLYSWKWPEDIEIEMKFKKDLIFTDELNNHFPQLNNLKLSQEAAIALRLAVILGKIGKELQKSCDNFDAINCLGVSVESYTTRMCWENKL